MFFKQVHFREHLMPAQCLGFLNGPFFGTYWTRFLCTVRSTRWIACGTSSERSRVKCRVQLVEDVGEARRKIWVWTKTVPWGLHVHADCLNAKPLWTGKYLQDITWNDSKTSCSSFASSSKQSQIHICRTTWNLVQQWWQVEFNLRLQENWFTSYTS